MKDKLFPTAGGLIVCAAVLLFLFAGSAAATDRRYYGSHIQPHGQGG